MLLVTTLISLSQGWFLKIVCLTLVFLAWIAKTVVSKAYHATLITILIYIIINKMLWLKSASMLFNQLSWLRLLLARLIVYGELVVFGAIEWWFNRLLRAKVEVGGVVDGRSLVLVQKHVLIHNPLPVFFVLIHLNIAQTQFLTLFNLLQKYLLLCHSNWWHALAEALELGGEDRAGVAPLTFVVSIDFWSLEWFHLIEFLQEVVVKRLSQ